MKPDIIKAFDASLAVGGGGFTMTYVVHYRCTRSYTGCSVIIVFFFPSVSSAVVLVFYLPGVCTHTDTEGKQRKARVQNILKSSEKHDI